jgi:TfoX/Sxy family transcriptional regulator of competence genes
MLDEQTRVVAEELRRLLEAIDGSIRPMFGGYCFYVEGKVVGTVCDGQIFVKRSKRDDMFEGYAELAPPYPGAKDSWRVPAHSISDEPDQLLSLIEQVATVLPARKARR